MDHLHFAKPSIDELAGQIRSLEERFPHVSREDRFILWFQVAAVTGDEAAASVSLAGTSGDKGIDAVHIDETAKTVFVTQGKYRTGKSTRRNETRNDVLGLAGIAQVVRSTADSFRQYASSLDPLTLDKIGKGRERILKRHYRLVLYYVTTGRIGASLRTEALNVARNYEAELEFYDGDEIKSLLKEYLEGVAPPVPSLELPVAATNPLTHRDPATGIEALVVTASGEAVGELYRKAGLPVFARNVRGYMGDTRINQAIAETLTERPTQFWYLNNGVTIVCSAVRHQSANGRAALWIRKPQIINGQQTTRVLEMVGARSKQASVLVRVIKIPSEPDDLYEKLVSRIVRTSNSQNQILNSDLVSNDQYQVRLYRELGNLGYLYVRKRESKGEARRRHKARVLCVIKKEELAQAAAATLFDPRVVRAGKERLFGDHYEDIFGQHSALDLLNRYWLMRRVSLVGRGYPNRAYPKWLVLHFAWKEFDAKIQRSSHFRQACERPNRAEQLLKPLDRAIESIFKAALQFFRDERGVGPKALDISNFFYQQRRHTQFQEFWSEMRGGHRERFNEQGSRFLALLAGAHEEWAA